MDRSDWGDDEAEPFRPPLPQEDRIWRHPSELGAAFVASPNSAPGSRGRGSVVLATVAAGVMLVAVAGVALRLVSNRTSGSASAAGSTSLAVARSSLASAGNASPTTSSEARGVDVKVAAEVKGGERLSAGVVVDQTTLVTTMAAIAGSTGLSAVLADGRRLQATLLGSDPRAGIAVLSVPRGGLRQADVTSAVPLRPGTKLWMAGWGEPGTVTALGRNTIAPDGTRLRHVIRLDVDGQHAKEGMALMLAGGKVVALCSRDAKGDVIGIPIDLATSAARSLREDNRLRLPWLGVSGRDATEDDAPGLVDGGAVLTGVDEGGPAATAGLLPGDIVVSLGNTKVRSISALVLAARAYRVGEVASVRLVRGGQSLTMNLTLGELQ